MITNKDLYEEEIKNNNETARIAVQDLQDSEKPSKTKINLIIGVTYVVEFPGL